MDLFRANSLFRNFEIKGPADRLLIILILFISDCLAKIGSARSTPFQIEASKSLNTLAVDNFPIPGDANFLLNAHYSPPSSRADAGKQISLSMPMPTKNLCLRLLASISHTSSSGACCTASREALCRRHRQAEQVVDVIPEETFHEQKLGDVGLWNDDEQCTKKSINNPTPSQIIAS